jgi:hypothetical protein
LNSYSYGQDNPITRKDPSGKNAFQDAVIFAHLGKTAYDTGTFTLFPDYNRTPEELNEKAFTAISGITTAGVAYLAGEGLEFQVSGGILLAEAAPWAKDRICATLVSCQSYFDTGVHVTIIGPNGPQIKITPLPTSGGNGPTSGGNGPTQGPVSGGGSAPKSGSVTCPDSSDHG